MAVVHVPFNFNPAAVDIHGTSTYTCPANKFARVLLVPITPAAELYVKKNGGSAEYMNSSISVSNNAWSGANGTNLIYALASGYTARRYNVAANISASNGTVDVKFGGVTFLTIPQNGSNSDTNVVDHLGPGNFENTNNGAGTTVFNSTTFQARVFRTGEVMPDSPDDAINPANIAGEIWLTAGDEISWGGGLIINEYVQPS